MSQHEEQCRHSRSWNKRLFTMNPVSPPTPRLLPVWAGLLLGAYTFVPGAIRNLVVKRKLGIALLMTWTGEAVSG